MNGGKMNREEAINYLKDIANNCEGKEVDGAYLISAVSIIEELLDSNRKLVVLAEDLRDPFNKHRREPNEETKKAFEEDLSNAKRFDNVEEAFEELLEEKKKRDEKLS